MSLPFCIAMLWSKLDFSVMYMPHPSLFCGKSTKNQRDFANSLVTQAALVAGGLKNSLWAETASDAE